MKNEACIKDKQKKSECRKCSQQWCWIFHYKSVKKQTIGYLAQVLLWKRTFIANKNVLLFSYFKVRIINILLLSKIYFLIKSVILHYISLSTSWCLLKHSIPLAAIEFKQNQQHLAVLPVGNFLQTQVC